LIDESRVLPSQHPAIGYWSAEPTDAVARLQRRFESGDGIEEHYEPLAIPLSGIYLDPKLEATRRRTA
jgi:hypothetical protein